MSETSRTPAVDGDVFRRTLAAHASGVVIVTAEVGGRPAGITASSFTSASLNPPLVSFYLDRASTTSTPLRTARWFAVNILAEDQAPLAARFSRKGIDRFAAPTRWRLGEFGVPVLDDVCAHVICRTQGSADVGDHILMVGLVKAVSPTTARAPLLYHMRQYGGFVSQSDP